MNYKGNHSEITKKKMHHVWSPKILVILNDPWKIRADDTAQMKKVNFFQTGKASTAPSKLENANFECTWYTKRYMDSEQHVCVSIYIYILYTTYEPHMCIYIYPQTVSSYSLNEIIIMIMSTNMLGMFHTSQSFTANASPQLGPESWPAFT